MFNTDQTKHDPRRNVTRSCGRDRSRLTFQGGGAFFRVPLATCQNLTTSLGVATVLQVRARPVSTSRRRNTTSHLCAVLAPKEMRIPGKPSSTAQHSLMRRAILHILMPWPPRSKATDMQESPATTMSWLLRRGSGLRVCGVKKL